MNTEPRNEDQACHAAMAAIKTRDGDELTITDRPDKTERQLPAVEMLFESEKIRYAMEHTRIESFPQQIADGVAFSRLLGPLEELKNLPGRFRLVVQVGAAKRIRFSEHQRMQNLVADWIVPKAAFLADELEAKGQTSISAEIPGVPFPLTLVRTDQHGSKLFVARFMPAVLEELRVDRMREALERKCPKLATCQSEGRRTVLVLESNDIALGNHHDIGAAFAKTITERNDPPDQVFLVETETRPWFIWALKEGTKVYPSQRLERASLETYYPVEEEEEVIITDPKQAGPR